MKSSHPSVMLLIDAYFGSGNYSASPCIIKSHMKRRSTSFRYYLDLVSVLTQKEIKVRYKNSFFGYLWSVAYPVAFTFVFFVAFKIVMKVPMENYPLFLISGLFPWQWFSNSVLSSSTCFLANASLIKKLTFPRLVIPLVSVLNEMIHFVLSVPVVIIFLVYYGSRPCTSLLYWFPILLSVQFLLTYGISLAVGSINLFFRDLERLVGILTTLIFYFTPIIYSEEMVPGSLRGLLKLNPVAPIMVNWRNLFLNGTIDHRLLLYSFCHAIVFFLFGYVVYRRLSVRFAEAI